MVAVVSVDVLAYGDHVFDDGLEVVVVAVGIKCGGIIGVIEVVCSRIGTEGSIHLQLIDAVLESSECLEHIHCGTVALGCSHGAAGSASIFRAYSTFPSVEAVGKVRIGEQFGDVCARSGLVGERSVVHGINLGCLRLYLFRVQLTLFQNVWCRTVGVNRSRIFKLCQVVLQLVTLYVLQVFVLLQVADNLFHLGLVGGIGSFVLSHLLIERFYFCPCCQELFDVVALEIAGHSSSVFLFQDGLGNHILGIVPLGINNGFSEVLEAFAVVGIAIDLVDYIDYTTVGHGRRHLVLADALVPDGLAADFVQAQSHLATLNLFHRHLSGVDVRVCTIGVHVEAVRTVGVRVAGCIIACDGACVALAVIGLKLTCHQTVLDVDQVGTPSYDAGAVPSGTTHVA